MENTKMTGQYTDPRELNQHDKEVFDKAFEGFTGVDYTPNTVSTQVVAGTNYHFFCDYKTVTLEPKTGKAIVMIFEELPCYGGKVVITGIVRQ